MNSDDAINFLKEKLKNKKENLFNKKIDQLEQEKINIIENLLNNSRAFMNIKMDTAINLLCYLEIDQDKILEVYKALISYNSIKGEFK